MNAIETKDIRPILEECFALDEPFINQWHIAAGNGLKACIDQTVSDLSSADATFRFYKVEDNERLVGFFGIEGINYLTTIFINPEHRTKDKVLNVWNLIRSHFPKEFYTAVYGKNTPAINFYSKNGQNLGRLEHCGHPAICFKLQGLRLQGELQCP